MYVDLIHHAIKIVPWKGEIVPDVLVTAIVRQINLATSLLNNVMILVIKELKIANRIKFVKSGNTLLHAFANMGLS